MQASLRSYRLLGKGGYDHDRLRGDTIGKLEPSGFSKFISERIRQKNWREKEDNDSSFTRNTIALKTGMSINMVKGIINRKNITKKRDAVIAICRAIGLGVYETNEALKRYPMPVLDPENMRDLLIIDGIRADYSVSEISASLRRDHFEELDLSGRKIKDREHEYNYYSAEETLGKRYEFLWQEVEAYNDGKSTPNQVELSSLYAPDMFCYKAVLELRRLADGSILQFTYPRSLLEEEILKRYDVQYDEELHLYDTRLKNAIDEKMLYIKSMLDDTKFYGSRYSMEIIDGDLAIFGECFNSEHPELSEYYQISVVGERYSFSASKRSLFLRRYLGIDYPRFYSADTSDLERIPGKPVEKIEKIANQEMVIIFDETSRRNVSSAVWQEIKMAKRLLGYIDQLKGGAQDLLERLKNYKAVFYVPEGIEDVERIYGLEGVLELKEDANARELSATVESITLDDGTNVGVKELFRSLELGLLTLDAVKKVKAKHGSVEGVLRL